MLALCFFLEAERYHHWRIYASGMDGVCIEFDGGRLLSALEATCHVRHRAVNYRKLGEMKSSLPDIDELPFLKRYAYEDEHEYRIIYVSTDQLLDKRDCKIDRSCIRKVVLSPWVPDDLAASLSDTLCEVSGRADLPIHKSQLVNHEACKGFAVAARSREIDVLNKSLDALKDAMMFLAIAMGGQPTAASHAQEGADNVGPMAFEPWRRSPPGGPGSCGSCPTHGGPGGPTRPRYGR